MELESDYRITDSVNPFDVGHGELEGMINSGFDKLLILDTNILLSNIGKYKSTELDETAWDALLDKTSNVYTTGVSLSEALYRKEDKVVEKLRENRGSLQEKVLKSYDKKIPEDVSRVRINHGEARNILGVVKNEFSGMSLFSEYNGVNKYYDKAIRNFDGARDEKERSEGVFRYFMTLAVDSANDIDTGSKNKDNIIFDAYNVAKSLSVSEEAQKAAKAMDVYLLSRDEDVKKIIDGMFDKVENRLKTTNNDTEKKLIKKFYDATDYFYAGCDGSVLDKHLMYSC